MSKISRIILFILLSAATFAAKAQSVVMPSMQAVQYRPRVTIQLQCLTISTGVAVEAVVSVTGIPGTTLTERGVCWSTNNNATTSDFKYIYPSNNLTTYTHYITMMATGNI